VLERNQWRNIVEEVKALTAYAAAKRKLFIFLRSVYQEDWASANATYVLEVSGLNLVRGTVIPY
jgi:hypothetical protein